MSTPKGTQPPMGQIPQQTTGSSWQAQQNAPPRGMSRETKIVLIVVVSVVSIVITIGAAFTWWILSQGLVSSDGDGDAHALGFSLASAGSNWTMTVAAVMGDMQPSEVRMTILDQNGAVKNPMSSIALSQLSSANWNTYRVTYQKLSAGSFIGVGDMILIDKATYFSGYRYQILDASRILATGLFR